MKLRIFQTLVCFILICCLIFACSPIQAEAVAISGSAVAIGVGIGLAVAVGLQALGIRQGADGAAFSSLVSDCAAALSPDWAINGLTTMLALTNDGVTRTYASRDFLQSILDWLFDKEVVTLPAGAFASGEPFTFYGGVTCTPQGNYVVFNLLCKNTSYFEYLSQQLYFLDGNKYVASNGNMVTADSLDIDGVRHYYIARGGATSNDAKALATIDLTHLGPMQSADLTRYVISEYLAGTLVSPETSYDLTLESVGQDIDTDYETYIDESIISVDFGIQFEDDPNTGRNEEENNKVGWVPTRLLTSTGDTYADQTQADAQSGLTDPEIVEGFNNNSGGGSDSGTSPDIFSSIKDFFTLSSDPAAWAIDLREFFPFCIPYDIYDFLSILAAEPEAPVFEWVIPVPQLGQTFELEVDLSAWDGVARLFRNLELLAFIVGLAYVTREKFIRG